MITKKITENRTCICEGKNKDCKKCNGTGEFKEYIYLHIDEKNKICISGDTLK